jgi:uncharacterized protein (DUF1778 family)
MSDATPHDERRRRPLLQERLETRVSAEEKALLQRAANLENRSVTDFIRSSAHTAATETIRRHETMTLSANESAAFIEALMNPPAPEARLRAAGQAHRELIGK